MIERSLLDRLDSRLSKFSPSNRQWYQFISDHKIELLNDAYEMNVDPEVMFKFQHRPKEFLDHYDIDPNMAWIILFINDINSEEDFTGLKTLFIFQSSETINEYYEQFINYYEELKSSDKELVG